MPKFDIKDSSMQLDFIQFFTSNSKKQQQQKSMKVLIVFATVCLAMAMASNFYLEAHWMDFKLKHKKIYKSSEEEVRKFIDTV